MRAALVLLLAWVLGGGLLGVEVLEHVRDVARRLDVDRVSPHHLLFGLCHEVVLVLAHPLVRFRFNVACLAVQPVWQCFLSG